MKTDLCAFLPKARSEGIISKEVNGEFLIYDRARDQAHCLNETAAAVWNLCDGRLSVSEIIARLDVNRIGNTRRGKVAWPNRALRKSRDGARQLEHLVWLALDQLRRSHLLEQPPADTSSTWGNSPVTNMSRREVVRLIGKGAAIAFPLVISMTVPTAVEAAASCKHHCVPCSSPIECCGTCATNVPGCVGPPMCT